MPLSSAFSDQCKISQTTIAVKNVENPYTSASTALNQCESVNAKVNDPTKDEPNTIIESICDFIFPLKLIISLTLDRYKNIIASALTTGDMRFTLKAISGLKGSIEKTLPIIRYNGLPGG